MGILISFSIILTWFVSLIYALGLPAVSVVHLHGRDLLLIFWIQFLHVGLFITTHDACHESLAPGRARVNLWLGRVSAFLYAGFYFDRMKEKHAAHHRNPGTDKDPDFLVSGSGSGHYFQWLFRFFINYLTLTQMLTMTALAQVLIHILHRPESNVFLFWVTPSVLSALQLFTFGTYLPHRVDRRVKFEDQHRARNKNQSFLESFVSCYHFGAWHLKHHREPWVPWYRLPLAQGASKMSSTQTPPAIVRAHRNV